MACGQEQKALISCQIFLIDLIDCHYCQITIGEQLI